MNYTLNQLEIFLKITETQSVTKAAEELHLTQPAVSIQLKNFQEQFEIPLTEVVGRKLYVTDFGKEIAESVQEILNNVHAMNYKTQAYKGKLTGKLKVSVVSTGKYLMPYFLSGFINQNDGVDLTMDVTNKMKVIESLEKNEVDFSLVSIIPDNLSVEKMNLLENRLYLVANKDAQIAKGLGAKRIFKKAPLIFREQGSGTRQMMGKFLEKNSINVQKKLELTSNEAVKQAVLAGLGYSIMPMIGIRNELRNGNIQIIPLRGLPMKTMWSLIWLKEKKLSPAALAFLDYINTHKANIIDRHFIQPDL